MENKKVFKVTKSYARKVSLKGITSQYDNIECATYISAPVEWADEEDFNKKLNILTKKVQSETERDIAVATQSLIDLSRDDKNSALIGNGDNIEAVKFLSSQIDGFDDVSPEELVLELPPDLEEVDLDLGE